MMINTTNWPEILKSCKDCGEKRDCHDRRNHLRSSSNKSMFNIYMIVYCEGNSGEFLMMIT